MAQKTWHVWHHKSTNECPHTRQLLCGQLCVLFYLFKSCVAKKCYLFVVVFSYLLFTVAYLKVRVVELVGNVPAQHEELLSLQQDRVEVTQAEEELAVSLRSMTAGELLFRYVVVQTLQICLQTLTTNPEMNYICSVLWLYFDLVNFIKYAILYYHVLCYNAYFRLNYAKSLFQSSINTSGIIISYTQLLNMILN